MNVLYGGLVVGITSLSPITIVPIVVSAASAVANGLCYYSVYSDYEKLPRLIAGIFADLLWLVSTTGLHGPLPIRDMLLTCTLLGSRGWPVLLQLPDPE